MAGPGDATGRQRLYTGRGRDAVVLGRRLVFYPGAPTIPTNVTGDRILGAHSDGAGAKIIDGIGPYVETVVPCEDIVVESVVCNLGEEDILHITVIYNPLPDDIYVVFNTSTGQVLPPANVNVFESQVDLTFDMSSPPADAGGWSFKIMRTANPALCFFVKPNCLGIN